MAEETEISNETEAMEIHKPKPIWRALSNDSYWRKDGVIGLAACG